jgi:hypothetical protein
MYKSKAKGNMLSFIKNIRRQLPRELEHLYLLRKVVEILKNKCPCSVELSYSSLSLSL